MLFPPSKFLPCGYPISAYHKDRFLSKVPRGDGCWLWRGNRNMRGYGIITYLGKSFYAHRVAYEFWVGQIPDGMEVRHVCDTPPCVNPEHLQPGTHADNMNDAAVRGQMPTGSQHPQAKLNESAVVEIRRRYANGEANQAVLASEFGVTHAAVRSLLKGKTWKHVPLGDCPPTYPDMRYKLSEETVWEIRQRYQEGRVTQKQLATEYGLSGISISRIVKGHSWTNAELGHIEASYRNRSYKLTEDIVREARRSYDAGEATPKQLAEQYGVSIGAMRSALRGKSWGWVK